MDTSPANIDVDDLIHLVEEEDVSKLVSSILTFDFSQYSDLTVDAYDVDDSVENNQNVKNSESVVFDQTKPIITPQVIEVIEDDLEFYEKVSLVFLLYDSDDLALQRLKIALRANQSGSIVQFGLISDWAAHETSKHWPDKFLEALCIIQNYSVIEKLGYSIENVKLRFLPDNRQTSLFVDLMRKALYHLCESFSEKQLYHLLELVQSDLGQQGCMQGGYNMEYMEMNILHWMSQRYLNVGIQGSNNSNMNIKNLTKHLKVMGELDLVDYFESLSRLFNQNESSQQESEMETQSVSTFSDQISMGSSSSSGTYCHGPRSSHSLTSQCQEEKRVNGFQNIYPVDPNNVGYCVIINQKVFYREPDPNYKHHLPENILETRVGTDLDRDRLSEAFLNFGFTVKIWENLSHLELMQAIREASTNLVKREHSCFVLCILSHGKKNAVYGANSIAVDMEEIEKSIHGKFCPKLMYKPKILIIQACQGLQQLDALPADDIATDGTTYSKTCPEISDMITFWSTVPGYAAFRDRITGSWFIKTLWNQLLLKETTESDMMSAFVSVIGQVCDKRAPIDGELKAMTPQFTTSFRKKLYFPYHREARKATAKRLLERYLFDHLVDLYITKVCREKLKKKKSKIWSFIKK